MGKSKKIFCEVCEKVFLPVNTKACVCSPECAIKYNSEEEIEKRFLVMKEQSKPLSEVLFNTKKVFQQWVRLRDIEKPCISCNKTEAKQWDGGHYFTAEEYPGLIFHPYNVHKQCSYCNDHLKGNVLEYRNGISKRIGPEKLKELEVLAQLSKDKKHTKKELEGITWHYKQQLKSLKQK